MAVVARCLALVALIVLGLAAASPGLAQSAVEVPEPSDVTLLALGLAGLIIGRYAARHRKND